MTITITEKSNISITNTFKQITYEIKSDTKLSSGNCKNLISAIAFGQDYSITEIPNESLIFYNYSVTVSLDSSD